MSSERRAITTTKLRYLTRLIGIDASASIGDRWFAAPSPSWLPS
jgi:hypothetical protein